MRIPADALGPPGHGGLGRTGVYVGDGRIPARGWGSGPHWRLHRRRAPARARGGGCSYTGGMTRLEVGQRAPGFTLETTKGALSLADALERSGEGVVVYFYPKAATPGCTKEACDFRDSLEGLAGAGYSVIGVSPDPLSALERFAEAQSLAFPLASDPSHDVLEAWGAWGEKKNYGRTITGVLRSTVVVAKDGTVALAQYNVKATGHVARLRKALGID